MTRWISESRCVELHEASMHGHGVQPSAVDVAENMCPPALYAKSEQGSRAEGKRIYPARQGRVFTYLRVGLEVECLAFVVCWQGPIRAVCFTTMPMLGNSMRQLAPTLGRRATHL